MILGSFGTSSIRKVGTLWVEMWEPLYIQVLWYHVIISLVNFWVLVHCAPQDWASY